MYDYIIVGGGIGGVVAFSLLKRLGKNVLLLEKLDYLGGCAGTFKKDGMFYNVGASTLVGLDEKLPLDILVKILNIKKEHLPVIQIDPSIQVFINEKVIHRYKDFKSSFEEIDKNFYHPKNSLLWNKIKQVSQQNWDSLYKILPFNPKSLNNILKQGIKNFGYMIKTLPYNLKTAESVIRSYIQNPSKDYIAFINSQILITTQCYWDEVNFSFATMGLTYTNLTNYYVKGGMSNFLESIIQNDTNVLRKEKVKKISKKGEVFVVETNKHQFTAKKVILNRTIWDYCELLDDDLKDIYCDNNIEKYNKIWSSATLYFAVKDENNLLDKHHYQILHEKNPHTGSYSFFVSVADKTDIKDGYKSVTISTHCKIDLWDNLDKEKYIEKKEILKDFVLQKLYEYLPVFKHLPKTDILVGTPKTFQRYTERYKGTVGGIPLRREYTMLNYPAGITSIKNLYLIGDSIFPGQGYPGVIVGVFNLLLTIEKDFHELFYRNL